MNYLLSSRTEQRRYAKRAEEQQLRVTRVREFLDCLVAVSLVTVGYILSCFI